MLFYEHLLILASALLPTYLIRFSVLGIPTNLLEAAIWSSFVVGVLSADVRQSWARVWSYLPKPIILFSFLFFLSAVLSTAISPHLETSLGILKGWIITPMVFGFMAYAATRENRKLKSKMSKALILSGLAVALLGLSQIGQLDRIKGPYDVPNSLALFLVPVTILAIFSANMADLPTWRASSKFSRSAAFIMFVALLFTQSLAGALSMLIIAGVYLVPKTRRTKLAYWLPIAAVLALCVVILAPKAEYLTQPGSSAYVRLQLWSISWDLVKENPILGLGLGTFEPAYQEKLHERFLQPTHYSLQPLPEYVFRDPHNWILSFWLNLGLIGLLSFIALHVYIFYWSFRHWDFIGHWSLGFGISAALIVLLLFGLVDTIYWKNDLAALHWLLLALMVMGASESSDSGLSPKTAG